MQICCTKKLLDHLKVVPEVVAEEDSLFSWHANLLIINRRKVVVLVNDVSRYTIILYGMKAKEFKNFEAIAMEGIRKAFQADGIKDEVIDQYLEYKEEVIYTKTINRTSVARMNKSCDNVYFYLDSLNINVIAQPEISKQANQFVVGDSKGNYIQPSKKMHEGLALFAGRPVFKTEAVVLKVTLRLEDYQIWRRLVVPTWKTFDQLHDMLQCAFDWQDYHLHDFILYDDKDQPIIHLVCQEESLAYPFDIEMKLERGVKLSEYLPMSKKILYNYDFGDDWKHDIVVEKVIGDYDKNYAVCLDGEGDRPPEDVGGEPGYEDYLKIISNPRDPEHEHILLWSKSQVARKFKLDTVNWQLERC